MKELSRRGLLAHAVRIVAGAGVAFPLMRRAIAADSCVEPGSESLRGSLHYASMTPIPAQPCKACSFFSADGGKAACGNCAIMSGPVDAQGHCDSWAPRSP